MSPKRRLDAVKAVSTFITECGGGRLSAGAAKRYGKGKFDIAWRLRLKLSEVPHEFHVLVDQDFPYSQPRIALPNAVVLEWPHVEEDRCLCLLPADAAVSAEDPAGVVRYLLGQACELVQESVAERNVGDFRDEFTSYWAIASDSDQDLTTLVEPSGPSRSIHVFRRRHAITAGDCKGPLVAWLRRRAFVGAAEPAIEEGMLLWLSQPLLPKEYPQSAADLRRLVEAGPDAERRMLEDHLVRLPNGFFVLLGFQTVHGACFGAVSIQKPASSSFRKRREVMTKGFRPGHLDRNVLLDRYLSPKVNVAKHNVQRADHLWIHGRDKDERQHTLREARVAVLGCGSLGAAVGRLLAQSGVGSHLFVDPELMDWCNVGRHVLGASSTRNRKADELASCVRRDFPHLRCVSSFSGRVGPAARKISEELRTCDLIVSAMGNWPGEGFLNSLQRSETSFPPIVYGWLEAHALAAHAVLIRPDGACLRCGVNDCGRPNFVAIKWSNEGHVLQSPACGATFSPYGPAELGWAQALVADAALDTLLDPSTSTTHRMWIGQTHRVHRAGGTWTKDLAGTVGEVKNGGFTFERPWPTSPSCPVCGGSQ